MKAVNAVLSPGMRPERLCSPMCVNRAAVRSADALQWLSLGPSIAYNKELKRLLHKSEVTLNAGRIQPAVFTLKGKQKLILRNENKCDV